MKAKIYLIIFLFFCLFIKGMDVLADSNNLYEYDAEISVKYIPASDFSTNETAVKNQLYNIIDLTGNTLKSGITNDNGVISFQCDNLVDENSLCIRVQIFAENVAAVVNEYDTNENINVGNNYYLSDVIELLPNQNNEIEILINTNDENYDLICVSQNALYAYEFFKNNYQDVLIANGEEVEQIDSVDIIRDYNDYNSNYKPAEEFITMYTNSFGTMVHEYAHYFDDFYNLSDGESAVGHNLTSFKVDKYIPNNISNETGEKEYEINNMKKVITEGFAAFCENLALNRLSNSYEVCQYHQGGELLERTFITIVNDLIDNTPEEENICIPFSDVVKIMQACYEQSSDYVLYDFLEYIVDNQIASRSEINHLVNINYVTQPIEQIVINDINYFKMEIYADEYNNITEIFTVFNRYYLRIYEKTNNGYTELEEIILEYNISNLKMENNKYYYLFSFSDGIKSFILNNNFKELYYNMEQINIVECYDGYFITSYETSYEPLSLCYNNVMDINVSYINDTNDYTWIAFEAPVESNYTIYSSGLSDVMCMIYRDRMDLNSLITGNDNLDGDNQNFLVNTYLSQGEKVYLKIIFIYNMANTTIHITFNYNEYLLIDSEKFILHGTEVRLNNGILNGTTITQGLSRIAYIPTGNWPSSRLDYHWFSSDESVATVSEYGTIQALSVDEQKTIYITAICKTNSAISFIQEITVVPDTSNIKRTINLTISIPDIQGFKIIELNSSCPNPLIGSYTWDKNENLFEISGTKLIRKWEGNFIVRGEYKYNKNYEVIITVTE